MKSNKGFSLVEIIIVVAIMAIMMTAVGFSVSYLNSTSRKQAANTIVSYIGKGQTMAMSKSNQYGIIFREESSQMVINLVYRVSDTDAWTEVTDASYFDAKVPVTIHTTNGDYAMNDGNDSSNIVITFDRTSGAFSQLFCDGSEIADGQITSISLGSDRTIRLVWRTGKYYIE